MRKIPLYSLIFSTLALGSFSWAESGDPLLAPVPVAPSALIPTTLTPTPGPNALVVPTAPVRDCELPLKKHQPECTDQEWTAWDRAHLIRPWERLAGLDHLFANDDRPVQLGRGIQECLSEDGWKTRVTNSSDPCFPDVLYTWGPVSLFQFYAKALRSPRHDGLFGPVVWPKSALFLSKSPLATFGYGDLSMRVKLRPGLKVIQMNDVMMNNDCSNLTPDLLAQVDNAIFYRQSGILDELVICSPAVVHSISYGTRVHSDEMIREMRALRQINASGLIGQVQLYSSLFTRDLFNPQAIDKEVTQFTFAHLLNVLVIAREMALQNQSVLAFNSQLPRSEKTAARHEETNRATYFTAK